MAATRGVDWEWPLTVPPDWVIRWTIAPSVPTLSHPGNTEKKPPGKRRLKSQNSGGSNIELIIKPDDAAMAPAGMHRKEGPAGQRGSLFKGCLLYTSDAADEEDSV